MNGLIDTHVHLTDPPYALNVEQVIEKTQQMGVRGLLVPGYSLESCREIEKMKARYPSIMVAAGIHPMYVTSGTPTGDDLRCLLGSVEKVAIGEVGLDNRRDAPPADLQETLFREQLSLAIEWDLPVIIHCVQAHDACQRILSDFLQNEADSSRLRGVIHRVSCSKEIARFYIEHGFHIGLGPDLFDIRRTRLQRLAAWIPETRILLETDAPYSRKVDLSVCDPWDLPEVLVHLAAIRKTPVDELGAAIARNAMSLLGV